MQHYFALHHSAGPARPSAAYAWPGDGSAKGGNVEVNRVCELLECSNRVDHTFMPTFCSICLACSVPQSVSSESSTSSAELSRSLSRSSCRSFCVRMWVCVLCELAVLLSVAASCGAENAAALERSRALNADCAHYEDRNITSESANDNAAQRQHVYGIVVMRSVPAQARSRPQLQHRDRQTRRYEYCPPLTRTVS